MPRARRSSPLRSTLVVAAALLLVGLLPSSTANGSPATPAAVPSGPSVFGPINLSLDRQFLGNLSVPSIAPGSSASLHYSLADPRAMGATLQHVLLSFQVYAFNGYPGDASALLPVANSPVLSNHTASGSSVNISLPSLVAGTPMLGSIGVATSANTPAGTFAIRTALSFNIGATAYRLESRGWFSATMWASATEAPNGTATLNLSELHVSGVIAETAVLVVSSDWGWALGALLVGAFVLLAAGAWVYSRRGPTSRSGAG
ncbi:MAG: hypothetical protein WAK40_07810 [Thermoplasmata archaeon]